MMQSSASKERDRPWEESPQGWPKKHPTGHKDLSWPFTNWRKVNTVVSKCLVFFHGNAPLLHYLMPEKGQVWAQKKKTSGSMPQHWKHPHPTTSACRFHHGCQQLHTKIRPHLNAISKESRHVLRDSLPLGGGLCTDAQEWGLKVSKMRFSAQGRHPSGVTMCDCELWRLQQPFAIWADLKWRPVAKPWVAWWEYTNQNTGWFVSAPVTTTPFSAAPFSTKRPKSQIHRGGPWRQGGLCTGIFPAHARRKKQKITWLWVSRIWQNQNLLE